MTKKELAEQYFELSNLRLTMHSVFEFDQLPLTKEEVYQLIKDSMEEVYTEEELKAYITMFSSVAGQTASLKVKVFQQAMQDKLMTAIINKEEEI